MCMTAIKFPKTNLLLMIECRYFFDVLGKQRRNNVFEEMLVQIANQMIWFC